MTDNNRNVVWSRDYYPFGASRIASGSDEMNKYTYEGREKDLETDLGNNWKRLFNYEGRFTQVDPLWQKYPSMSPYVRVANNPLRYVDPDGEDITSIMTEDEEGNIHYEITYTATLVDNSTEEITQEQLQEIANNIKIQIEKSYTGKRPDGKVTWKTTADIQVGGKPRDSDNIISIEQLGQSLGRSRILGLTQKLDVDLANTTNYWQIGRTGAHEFGHGAGLPGIIEPDYNLMVSGGKGINIFYYQILTIHKVSPWSGMLP